jgi:hypothetical protein
MTVQRRRCKGVQHGVADGLPAWIAICRKSRSKALGRFAEIQQAPLAVRGGRQDRQAVRTGIGFEREGDIPPGTVVHHKMEGCGARRQKPDPGVAAGGQAKCEFHKLFPGLLRIQACISNAWQDREMVGGGPHAQSVLRTTDKIRRRWRGGEHNRAGRHRGQGASPVAGDAKRGSCAGTARPVLMYAYFAQLVAQATGKLGDAIRVYNKHVFNRLHLRHLPAR